MFKAIPTHFNIPVLSWHERNPKWSLLIRVKAVFWDAFCHSPLTSLINQALPLAELDVLLVFCICMSVRMVDLSTQRSIGERGCYRWAQRAANCAELRIVRTSSLLQAPSASFVPSRCVILVHLVPVLNLKLSWRSSSLNGTWLLTNINRAGLKVPQSLSLIN